jgi:phosphate-selective porin OprO/OprP
MEICRMMRWERARGRARRAPALAVVASAALLSGVAGAQQPPPAAEPAKATLKASEKDGFVIESADGAYRLRLTGYAQLDGRFYLGDEAVLAIDSFLLRRVRPILSGTLAKRFDFYLNPDFGGGTTVLQDAYLDARFSGAARLRLGKMKPPVGLERLQSGSALSMVERALPTDLVPSRDVGAQLHGELRGGRVSYAVGLFNGVVDGGSADIDTGDSKDVAARILFQPLRTSEKSPLRGLAFGLAGTLGDQAGALPSYRSGGQLVFFFYTVGTLADGQRTRIVPQAFFHLGRFGAQGEWARSSQEVKNASARARIENTAWQATASFVITGEAASLAGVHPKRAFDPGAGAWGALELVARANALDVDADAFAQDFADATRSARSAEAWAIGLNWYLNRNVRLVASYERTRFEGGARGGDRPPENALFFRTQLAY